MKTMGRFPRAASCVAASVLVLWILGCANPDEGTTVLHWAARTGNLTVLKSLVEGNKEKVDVRDGTGRTPLLVAVQNGNAAAVEFLIQHQADITAVDGRGMSVLHHAAMQNNAPLIMYFLGEKYRAKTQQLLTTFDRSHRRPIETALTENRREAAMALINGGSPIDASDSEGMTLLHWAAKYGYDDLAQLLIAKGTDLNTKDKKGRVPLHLAASEGNKKIVELLIAAGADATIPWPRASLF
jgi:ankyrin repeat protein